MITVCVCVLAVLALTARSGDEGEDEEMRCRDECNPVSQAC